MFNFEDEEFNENMEPMKEHCYCEDCAHLDTVEKSSIFAEILQTATSSDELEAMLYDMIEDSKTEGIKEYLFHEINNKRLIVKRLEDLQNGNSVEGSARLTEDDLVELEDKIEMREVEFYIFDDIEERLKDIDRPHWSDLLDL